MTTEYFIVTASKPGTWLREKLDPRSWVRMFGEGLISDYAEKMEMLREADDKIQAWTEDLSDLAKRADKALAARRLVDVAIILNEINERFKKIKQFESFIKEVSEKSITQFQQESENFIPEQGILASDEKSDLIVEAGIFNDLKRKFLAEKLQSKEQKEKFLALKILVQYTKQVVESVKKTLKEMEKNRAYGNIGKYLDGLKKINIKQQEFQSKFQDIYSKHLKSLVEDAMGKNLPAKNENLEAVEPKSKPQKSKPSKSQKLKPAETVEENDLPIESEDDSKLKKIRIIPPSPEELGQQLVPSEMEENLIPDPPTDPMDLPQPEHFKNMSEIDNLLVKKNNIQFLTELMKASSYDDPSLLVQMILKHSENLDNMDSDMSLKLLAIVEGVLND